LTTEEAAALLIGCASEAAAAAWGAHKAAMQIYLLSLQLAKCAGITPDNLQNTTKH
jgi:hypothetical protein